MSKVTDQKMLVRKAELKIVPKKLAKGKKSAIISHLSRAKCREYFGVRIDVILAFKRVI